MWLLFNSKYSFKCKSLKCLEDVYVHVTYFFFEILWKKISSNVPLNQYNQRTKKIIQSIYQYTLFNLFCLFVCLFVCWFFGLFLFVCLFVCLIVFVLFCFVLFFDTETALKVLSTIPYFNFHFIPHLLIFLQFRDPSYVVNLSTKAVLQKWHN